MDILYQKSARRSIDETLKKGDFLDKGYKENRLLFQKQDIVTGNSPKTVFLYRFEAKINHKALLYSQMTI